MEVGSVETLCVVGAGFMGAQIGLHCAVHGRTVRLVDASEQALKRAAESHTQELERRLEKQLMTRDEKQAVLSRIHLNTNLWEGATASDLVIEAVPERLALKREVFSQLDRACPERTILATNSSSIRISALEDATGRPDRVLNMHFYPPVWQCTVVELMRGTSTSDETVQAARQFAYRIGLTPLVVRKESTGFIFNRVWRAIKKECLHLVDDGVASHEDVDRAWMIVLGMSIGPFGLMDMVGLDVVRDIERVYYVESGDELDAPPRLLVDKIEKGELGMKAGKGFYTYPRPAFQDPAWLKGAGD
jgi:3-hydroxybutyryl-CoA dehydrogenase